MGHEESSEPLEGQDQLKNLSAHDRRILQELAAELAAETGCKPPDITIYCCPPPCDHRWDGKEASFDNCVSVTCSKCGVSAIDASMFFL